MQITLSKKDIAVMIEALDIAEFYIYGSDRAGSSPAVRTLRRISSKMVRQVEDARRKHSNAQLERKK